MAREDVQWHGVVYHGQPSGSDRYQLGLATAPSAVGPWSKSADPFFAAGAKKEWDHGFVASGNPKQYNDTHWLMYYSGAGDTGCSSYCVEHGRDRRPVDALVP